MQNSKRKLENQLNGAVQLKKSSFANFIKTEASVTRTENSVENISNFQQNVKPHHRVLKTSFRLPQIKYLAILNLLIINSLLENFPPSGAGQPLSDRRHLKQLSVNYPQWTSRQNSNSKAEGFSNEKMSQQIQNNYFGHKSSQSDVGIQQFKDFSNTQNQLSKKIIQKQSESNFRQSYRKSIQKIGLSSLSDNQKQVFKKRFLEWQSGIQPAENKEYEIKENAKNSQSNETLQRQVELNNIQRQDQQTLNNNEQYQQENVFAQLKVQSHDSQIENIVNSVEIKNEEQFQLKQLPEVSEDLHNRLEKNSETAHQYLSQKSLQEVEGEIRAKKISEIGEIRSKKPSEIFGEIRPKQDSKDIRSKASSWFSQSSCGTQKSDESHHIWNNEDLQLRGVDFEDLEKKDTTQQFLSFYKMRFGGFPGAQQKIANEDVIRVAINFAKANKKMFRKYFPTNRIIFEDDNDYSQEHQITSDPNFLKYVDYISQFQGDPSPQLESIKEVREPSANIRLDHKRGLKTNRLKLQSHNKLQKQLVKFDLKKKKN